MPSGRVRWTRARCESPHARGRRAPRRRPGHRGHHGAMTPAREHRRPAPPPPPPPVVGGRFAPIMGLRRNAVDYAESMWRRHGDLVHMVVGPPGSSRDVWWVHHPDGAARVLSGSSWRAYSKQRPGARRDRPLARARACSPPRARTGPGRSGSSSRCSPRRPSTATPTSWSSEIEAVVGEWDTERLPHGRPRPADAAAHPARGAGGPVRRLRRRRPAARAPLVPGRVRHHPAPRARAPCGCRPASRPARVRRGRAARDELFGVCDAIVAGTPRGPHHRRDRPAQPPARRARRRRAARRRGGAQPGAALHARRARDHGHRADLRPAPARPPPGRPGRRARRGARGARRPAPDRGRRSPPCR